MSDDREKLSFSERDRLLREKGRGERPPGGRVAKEEQRRATGDALREADALFSEGPGGAEGAKLAQAMRDAHGSEGFADACRVYLAQVGVPRDVSLLALLLDASDPELLVPALEALLALKEAGSLEISAGMRSQLRILEQDPDDTLAGISEELLG